MPVSSAKRYNLETVLASICANPGSDFVNCCRISFCSRRSTNTIFAIRAASRRRSLGSSAGRLPRRLSPVAAIPSHFPFRCILLCFHAQFIIAHARRGKQDKGNEGYHLFSVQARNAFAGIPGKGRQTVSEVC